ncbi:hypothetical protein EMIHUDRAFT_432056 [Emiliania huxleyi CCMP1516]|uniref:Uncharacterized protein n=2 Tax=Emiliania huxleyi TaxID=2903 RepID=A0A0D3JH40_EMIH1|nr:hypothetical protein EMIHUDRAFT_432056 [Emiliania huxleyi CCMP1516]EOD22825.1 hypothetical protein EMIHUDRAFT_432056 [Emiliania huxleyi CCMP1516]|eukprot:XP_005775254.1 hypothetical protein EMIHUDRAFT_432056 [Emiliania huxleyi CCMP1516]
MGAGDFIEFFSSALSPLGSAAAGGAGGSRLAVGEEGGAGGTSSQDGPVRERRASQERSGPDYDESDGYGAHDGQLGRPRLSRRLSRAIRHRMALPARHRRVLLLLSRADHLLSHPHRVVCTDTLVHEGHLDLLAARAGGLRDLPGRATPLALARHIWAGAPLPVARVGRGASTPPPPLVALAEKVCHEDKAERVREAAPLPPSAHRTLSYSVVSGIESRHVHGSPQPPPLHIPGTVERLKRHTLSRLERRLRRLSPQRPRPSPVL